MLELHWRQSGRKCIRWIGLCIRPKEMTLLLGSHGPTMNVCIAKFTDCPWPIIHCCSPRVRCQTTAQTNGPSDPSQHGPVTLTTHKISVPENCYTQTHWTQEKYTAYAHTPTHTSLVPVFIIPNPEGRGPRRCRVHIAHVSASVTV